MTARLSPEDLVKRVAVLDVDDVALMPGNPNQGDTGAIHMSMERFGQVETILVAEVDGRPTVINGNHRVIAERQARRFDGKLAAVDVTGLGWEEIEGIAAGLALNHTSRLGFDDPASLADMLRRIYETDAELMAATSYDEGDLNALLARLEGSTDPLREWAGMPDYSQDDLNSVFHVTVHFATAADADGFFEMIDRPKRSSMWWPQRDDLHETKSDIYDIDETAVP